VLRTDGNAYHAINANITGSSYGTINISSAGNRRVFMGFSEAANTYGTFGVVDDSGVERGIQITRATGAATFSSSITATGFFVSSDITLKTLTQDKFNASKIDAISYKWKTDLQGKTHVGYSAQQVQQYMPDAVNTDSNGQLSVDYIQILVQKIAHLEQKLKEHGLD
jgi:hypothetical protein